jgi:hypothetical protein
VWSSLVKPTASLGTPCLAPIIPDSLGAYGSSTAIDKLSRSATTLTDGTLDRKHFRETMPVVPEAAFGCLDASAGE